MKEMEQNSVEEEEREINGRASQGTETETETERGRGGESAVDIFRRHCLCEVPLSDGLSLPSTISHYYPILRYKD